MSRVINVITKKGQSLSAQQMTKLLDERGGFGDKFAIFNDIKMAEEGIQMVAESRWGIQKSGTFLWGAKTLGSRIDPDSLHTKNWDKISDKHKDNHMKGLMTSLTRKALATVSGSGLTDMSVWVPTIIAPGVIVDVIAKRTPLYAMVPKYVMTSKIMQLNRRAADVIDSIDFSAENKTVLTELDQDYDSITVTAKLLFVAGVITHFAQVATQETIDLFAQEVNDHFVDMIGFKEKVALRGETSATGTWAAHLTVTNGYDGIVKRIESAASGNLTILSSQAIQMSHVDLMFEDIHANNGVPSAIICDPSTFTRLRTIARDFKKLGENDTQFGFPNFSMSIDAIPVFPSNFMPRVSGQKAAICFDINALQYRVLLPDTYIPVAQDASPTFKFFFETFEAFVVLAPEWCAAVINGT